MKYIKLVELFQELESTSKRLQKTDYISKFIKDVDELEEVVLLLQGRVFPLWDRRKIGVAARMILKAINIATGFDFSKVEDEWKRTGDLGKTAQNLVANKKQATLFSTDLTVKKVFSNLKKLAGIEGLGTVDVKVKLISELLTSAKPLEARYIVRTLVEELRVGAGEGVLRDSIIWAYLVGFIEYDKKKNSIVLDEGQREQYNEYLTITQEAFDITNDFATVAAIAKKDRVDGLKRVSLAPGRPIKVMLGPKVKSFKEAFKRFDKLEIEEKLDGFRMQIHKYEGKVKIFTRRMEEVTSQFPEVIKAVNENVTGDTFIIDGEAIGFDKVTGKYTPFQKISQRIKRKHDIYQIAKELPVELVVFDVLYYGNVSMLKMPFIERREFLKNIVKEQDKKLKIVKNLVTDKEEEALMFYNKCLINGLEGVMIKGLDTIYRPGKRVDGWMKLKPTMQELDLVIVAAEFGHGKRSEWFSSFTLACKDDDTGSFMEIGKVGTGFKEKASEGLTFEELTNLLKPLIVSESSTGVKVKPSIVVEVLYEEIQKSPSYGSGYALRFPRVSRLREDRGADDCSTLEFVQGLFSEQS
ncbi:MAG: ATP-dependent DNA ligase, partial [Nanoarchaeota archaeon]|nr:ATP-dependent DNA ligase [Nanoarchaeota archaeon]